MPRKGGNLQRSRMRRHHKNMKSGAHGKGHDRKIKDDKQLAGQARTPKQQKKKEDISYEPA